MTTNFSHTNCSHPKTSKARAACRKAMAKGTAPAPFTTAPVLPRVDLPMTHLSDQAHMGRHDAMRITQDLLRQHGLDGWHLTFDNSRRRAGACNYTYRRIQLSLPLMAQRSWADTHMTITHEIAHALTPGHKHDQVWAAKHRELGGNGQRCFEHADDTAPWIGTCAHGKQFSKYRAPKHPDAQYRCKCVRNAPGFKFYPNPNA
ncbi:SprT-like protease [Mycobacterium phage NoShow]|nr:SprT-like protease [Mycobacterium phage NoShow]